MPLLDHFHAPLLNERHWEGFHAQWAGCISGWLNRALPKRYFAEQQTHVGSRVEVDVATFDFEPRQASRPVTGFGPSDDEGGVATLVAEPVLAAEPTVEAPPAPDAVVDAVFPDSIEVLVYSTEAGPTLVAAVELVSPGNKDRPDARRAFVAKCATYLLSGVGVMVVDIVTSRPAELHGDLMTFLGHPAAAPVPADALYAAAYRPTRDPWLNPPPPRRSAPADQIAVWTAGVAVGGVLPVLHLPLDRGQFVPLDLEATYAEARQRSRL